MSKLRFFAPMLALVLPTAAHAVPGGTLGTLGSGAWFCELPGDAETQPVPRPEANFAVVPDSSYTTASGERGTYLLLGDLLTMTSGPREGERYRLETSGMVRQLDSSGEVTTLRCVRAGDPAATAVAAPPRPAEASREAPR